MRHDASETIPEMLRAEKAVAHALAHATPWRSITKGFRIGSETAAVLLDTSSRMDKKTRRHTMLTISKGEYAVDAATAKAFGFQYALYRFVRAGASPDALPSSSRGAADRKTDVPIVSTAVRSLARTVSCITGRPKNPLLLVDAGLARAWNGVFDDRGRNALLRGDECDYDRLPTSENVLVRIGDGRAALLPPSLATTFVNVGSSEGIVVQLHSGDGIDLAIASALGARASDWRPTKRVLEIGRAGALVLDAAARGARPKKGEVVDVPLPRGRYAIAHASLEGALLREGRRCPYIVEAHRLRRS